jgi:two-component sensor histidine kinase
MEWLLQLIPPRQPLLVRYGVSTAMVALAFGLRFALQGRGGPYGFILFVPPILAAALLFDRGSGLLALAVATVLSAAVLDWNQNAEVHIGALASFVAVGLLLVFVGEGLHRALERAQKAERSKDLLLVEKDLLLREMSHRVKNKFTMILSLIGLQSRHAQPDGRAALEAIARRVRVIASIHDQLQAAPRDDNRVNLAEYLEELGRSLADSVRELRPITVAVQVEPIDVAADKALSLGLIVNELVTNALKYAFEGQAIGRVQVALIRNDDYLELSISDNGKGCPEGSADGLGTQLVGLLVEQLGGKLLRQNLKTGCQVSVRLPVSVTE